MAETDVLEELARFTGSVVVEGSPLELLVNGCEIFPPMLEAIESAEQSVDLLTFVYWQGEIAEKFARALAAAARRGVRVRVLIDGFGGSRMPGRLADLMREAGCKVDFFRPLRFATLRKVNFRTHRKVLVIDRTVGFTGGVGIAEEWTGDARNRNEWRDDHFKVVDRAGLDFLERAFDENWREVTGRQLVRAAVSRDAPRDAADRSVAMVGLLGRAGLGPSPIGLAFWHLVRSARSRLWIQTPYFAPDDELVEALADAGRRGVDVRVMVAGDPTDQPLCLWALWSRLEELQSAGVQVLTYEHTMMHCKTLTADAELSAVGSANLDRRSFSLNDELMIVLRDAQFTARLDRQFEEDSLHCRSLSNAVLSLRQRLLAGLARRMDRQL